MDDSGDNIDQEEEFSSGDFDENTAVHTKSKTIRMSPEKTKIDKHPSPALLNSSINPTSAQSSIAPQKSAIMANHKHSPSFMS
jgi:hypothetical protein